MMMILVLIIAVCTSTSTVAGVCTSNIPTTGSSAVELAFYSNPSGGTLGADCPVSCAGTPIKRQFYAVVVPAAGGGSSTYASNPCLQWPGNSGENSMKSGTCSTGSQSYTYDQWTNCDCSGAVGSHKEVFVSKCVVDKPPTLCVKILDFTACGGSTTSNSSSASSSSSTAGSTAPSSSSAGGVSSIIVPLLFLTFSILWWMV